MQCEQYQELILTDYLDGEMNAQERKNVEQHLTGCARCREFAQNAQKMAIEPFGQIGRLEPSDRLWRNIKEAIESDSKQTVSDSVSDFLERLKRIFPVPQPAFALAAVVVLLITVMTVMPRQNSGGNIVKVNTQDQIEYLVSIADEAYGYDLDDNGDYGTVFEEYFL